MGTTTKKRSGWTTDPSDRYRSGTGIAVSTNSNNNNINSKDVD
jgi:hypothetical protein